MKSDTSSSKQAVFEDGKLILNPHNLTREDMIRLSQWKRTPVDCPWCLLRAPLSNFAKYIKSTRKGMKKLSFKQAECPECHQVFRMRTLRQVTNMSVRDYAIWFWTNIYMYKSYERVTWESLTARIKMWPYADSNTFWDIWRKMSPKHGGMTARQIEMDEADYTDYEARMKKVDEYRKRQDI